MREELVAVFCAEYTKHLNFLSSQDNVARTQTLNEMETLEKERANLIQAIKDGVPAGLVKDDLVRVTERQSDLKVSLDTQPARKPFLHPVMASGFQQSIMNLAGALNQQEARAEASKHLRGLVDKVVLTPREDEDSLRIDLYGDLAGILNMATGDKARKNRPIIERLELSAVNDNSPQALQDSVGSGGRI